MKHVVIVVPGIMGSELRLGDEVIWPGSAWSLIAPYKKMAELMRPDLKATGLLRDFGIFKEYSSLLDDLETCGFNERGNPPTLYTFPYDWRKNNAESAQGLASLIDQAQNTHKNALEVTIIAHSLGGLVSRYYLESGDFNLRPGFGYVKNLITIGTPHRGAPLALTAALGKEKRLFLNSSQVLQLASDPRYPALYQLLPPPGEPFAWGQEDTRLQPMDIYDRPVAGSLGLIDANLQAARAFRAKLEFAKRPAGVRYFAFFGTRQTTATMVTLFKSGAKLDGRARTIEDSGDGTVPLWSGQLQGVQSQPVGGEHATLFRSDELRQTLAVLLGVPGVLAAPFRAQVSVTPKVVEPEGVIHVALVFPSGVGEVNGSMWLERVNTDETGKIISKTPRGKPSEIGYSGVAVEKIGTMLTAPDLAGFYEVVFQDKPTGLTARDEVIVQGA